MILLDGMFGHLRTNFQIHFPYAIHVLDGVRFVLLNREYRLLGDLRERWIDDDAKYYAYLETGAFTSPGLTLASLNSVTLEPPRRLYADHEHYEGWLYHDACVPTDSKAHWDAYSERLYRLLRLDIPPDHDES